MSVGIIGLGIMGSRMAARQIDAGHTVTVWNRSPLRTAPLADLGAAVADSPRSAAADADVVISMVRDDAASRGSRLLNRQHRLFWHVVPLRVHDVLQRIVAGYGPERTRADVQRHATAPHSPLLEGFQQARREVQAGGGGCDRSRNACEDRLVVVEIILVPWR